MKRNKDGTLAIPKEVWSAKATAHRSFSQQLSELLKSQAAAPRKTWATAIQRLLAEHAHIAALCDRMKTGKKGRPGKEPINELAAMRTPTVTKVQRGQQPWANKDYDVLTYKAIENERSKLREARKPSTIAAAIKLLLLMTAPNGKSQYEHLKRNTSRMRSAYGRGKTKSVG